MMNTGNVDTRTADTVDVSAGRDLPHISIVVIGRNEGQRLVRCLKSVKQADYPVDRYELIYVDTDSTDDSCTEAEKLGFNVIRIKPERPCAAAARNAGLKTARHRLIQFLDGDTILNPSWLKKAAVAISGPGVGCVFGRLAEVAPTATIYNFWTHHDWYIPPGQSDTSGGVAMFRREVLLRAGGYDSSLIAGEERDLCHRLIRDQGIVILSLEEPMALHDINITRFGQYWRRSLRAGYGYAQVAARYPGLKRWRRRCLRNIVHALTLLAAVALSLGFWSVWPVAIWALLLLVGIGRDALRCRTHVGGIGGSLLCAVHHYLSKLPTVFGHLAYYRRHFLGGPPKALIEYRGDPGGQEYPDHTARQEKASL